MACSVRDVALMLSAISGPDPRSPSPSPRPVSEGLRPDWCEQRHHRRRPCCVRHYLPLVSLAASLAGGFVRNASMSYPALFAPAWYALSMNSSRVSLGEGLLRIPSYNNNAVPPSGSQLAASGLSGCSVKPSGSGAA